MQCAWLSAGVLLLLLLVLFHFESCGSAAQQGWHEPVNASFRYRYREEVRRMFIFGYDNYMQHAFPLDELNPHACSGRGVCDCNALVLLLIRGPNSCLFSTSAKLLCVARDYGDHTNININDVLGNYSLGLIDSLDTLAIMGNRSEFARAVALVIKTVPSFDLNSTVQIFESNIRVLGGLLSAHAIAVHPAFEMGTVLLPRADPILLCINYV